MAVVRSRGEGRSLVLGLGRRLLIGSTKESVSRVIRPGTDFASADMWKR